MKNRNLSIVVSVVVAIGYLLYFFATLSFSLRFSKNIDWFEFILIHVLLISFISIFLAWFWLKKTTAGVYLNFFILWLFLNYIGGFICSMFLGLGVGSDNFFIFPLFYTALSVGQYIILRRYFANSYRWILFTGFGAVASLAIIFLILKLPSHYLTDYPHTSLGIIIGFCIGIAQWFCLKQWVNHSGWWIFGTVIGTTVVALINYDCNCGPESILSLLVNIGIIAAFYGGVYGAISGIFLTPIIAPILRSSVKVI